MPNAHLNSLLHKNPRTLVMGVLNVTPDSFSDGGDFFTPAHAFAQAQKMLKEGADILDIGGESTRPGHLPIPASVEQARVLPIISALKDHTKAPLSIDTYKASTAEMALKVGADLVNDIWGLQKDPEMAGVVAAYDVPVIIMHNRAVADETLDIEADMLRFFERSLTLAQKAGIAAHNIILDVGIGFGKTRAQNFEILNILPKFKALGYPLLVGVSRKSLLANLYPPDTPPQARIFGSLALHLDAVLKGADIVRVHDVKAHVEALRALDFVHKGVEPVFNTAS
jgi:dihydropteroate synthase